MIDDAGSSSLPGPRIALVHALAESIAPVHSALQRCWPSARPFNLLEDSLSRDRQVEGDLTDAMVARFLALGRYAAESGPPGDPTRGVLFTCSAFGPAIAAVKGALHIPVLGPHEAAFDEAIGLGPRIGVLVTFAPSAASLRQDLEDLAAARGATIQVTTHVVADALAALAAGDGARHDELIAAAAQTLDCDVLVLGQFSMARARARVADRATERVVLTTPEAAVNRLRALVQPGSREA